MEFRLCCPACGEKLKADEEDAGRTVDCRGSRGNFLNSMAVGAGGASLGIVRSNAIGLLSAKFFTKGPLARAAP